MLDAGWAIAPKLQSASAQQVCCKIVYCDVPAGKCQSEWNEVIGPGTECIVCLLSVGESQGCTELAAY